ncbi:CD276 antigen-like [Mugil cephalus]|uniref:CD276 antigen-like n=1 Tax=Mugil cephalus TaxID=48193 RepID=UPI001FB6D927|nr:CD276 antigen-like [Mugil cephalus]
MTSLKFAFYLTGLFLWRLALTNNAKDHVHLRQESGFISRNVGENVTLRCFYKSDVAAMFYWYKQSVGDKPKLVSSFYKHDPHGTFIGEFKGNPRFSLEIQKGNNHLKISDLDISDTATYYCVSCYAYKFEFAEGVTVSVKGSGLNLNASVHQSPSETVQLGDSVTLNCTVYTGTCDGEHRVYWFKDSEEPHPGLIYTHGDANDQCERNPHMQTQTCVYNLAIQSLDHSHNGTYYCAVASCGYILFGNGTQLELADDFTSSDFLVHFLSGVLAFTILLSIVMAFLVCRMYKSDHCPCTESQGRSSDSSGANGEDYQDADNLHYAALRKQNFNRSRRQMDDTYNQCVYSTVRH